MILLAFLRGQHAVFPQVDHTGNVFVMSSKTFKARILKSGFFTAPNPNIICVRRISFAFIDCFRMECINGRRICTASTGID
jgi:hypothetical protein